MQFLLITDQGIEDLVRDELLESRPDAEVECNPFGFPGHLRVGGVEFDDLLPLRTIHHVIELRGEAEADDLETIRHAVARIDVAEMENAASFRVTSVREGRHPFRHMEIQQVAGAALQKRYGTPVDLEGYALYASHGGIYRTAKARKSTIVLGRGTGYAIEHNLKLDDLDNEITKLSEKGKQ